MTKQIPHEKETIVEEEGEIETQDPDDEMEDDDVVTEDDEDDEDTPPAS